MRDTLVRTRTRYISLIRALRRQRGWRVPSGSAEEFPRRVLALPLPGHLRSEVAPLLAVMRHLQHQLAYSDERITAFTQTDERVRRVQSVPNVGPVTAAAFVAAIDEVRRFHRAHEVEAYLGLVPRELSSEETQRRGRITKAGSSRVRWLVIQAAVSMLRLHDPVPGSSLHSCAMARCMSRHGARDPISIQPCRPEAVTRVGPRVSLAGSKDG